MKDTQNIKVWFHIGRGGHFNNGGFKSYRGVVNSLADLFDVSTTIIAVDEDSNTLPEEEWMLLDGGGNVILKGREQLDAEVGILDWDGEYDTDIVRHLSECDDDEYQLILDAAERGEYVEKAVLSYACSALDKLMATNIKVYPSKMELLTQDGCITLQRDDFSVYTEDEEDEVRVRLEEKCFISQSIDEIIDNMKIYQWFSDEVEEEG